MAKRGFRGSSTGRNISGISRKQVIGSREEIKSIF